MEFNQLLEQGFFHFTKILSESEIKEAQDCFHQSLIDYQRLDLVNKVYLQKVSEKLSLPMESLKYRASNNNNSTDAGMFHRDIHLTQKVSSLEIYTCLLYLDDSWMEIIPGSHQEPVMTYLQAFRFLSKRQKLNLKPGDILIFHSSLIHRGLFVKKQKQRRLIQQFACLPIEKIDKVLPCILHAPCPIAGRNTNAFWMQKINRSFYLNNFLNYFVYLNIARGYSYHFNLKSKIDAPDILGISPETNQTRIKINPGILQASNKYVINEKYKLEDLKPEMYKTYDFYSHYANHFLLGIKVLGGFLMTGYIVTLCIQSESR